MVRVDHVKLHPPPRTCRGSTTARDAVPRPVHRRFEGSARCDRRLRHVASRHGPASRRRCAAATARSRRARPPRCRHTRQCRTEGNAGSVPVSSIRSSARRSQSQGTRALRARRVSGSYVDQPVPAWKPPFENCRATSIPTQCGRRGLRQRSAEAFSPPAVARSCFPATAAGTVRGTGHQTCRSGGAMWRRNPSRCASLASHASRCGVAGPDWANTRHRCAAAPAGMSPYRETIAGQEGVAGKMGVQDFERWSDAVAQPPRPRREYAGLRAGA